MFLKLPCAEQPALNYPDPAAGLAAGGAYELRLNSPDRPFSQKEVCIHHVQIPTAHGNITKSDKGAICIWEPVLHRFLGDDIVIDPKLWVLCHLLSQPLDHVRLDSWNIRGYEQNLGSRLGDLLQTVKRLVGYSRTWFVPLKENEGGLRISTRDPARAP